MTQKIVVAIEGQDKLSVSMASAAQKIDQFSKNVGGAAMMAGKFSGALGPLGVALGVMTTPLSAGIQLMGNLGRAIAGSAQEAVGAYADYERMTLSLKALAAREISMGKEVETSRKVRVALTQAETEELANLERELQRTTISQKEQAAALTTQGQRVWNITNMWTDHGTALGEAEAKYDKMSFQLEDTSIKIDKIKSRISDLSSKQGQWTTVTETTREGVMDMAKAMEIAGPAAEDLLRWVEKVGIESPFESKDIALAVKNAMQYQFNTEEAKRLTMASLDFAAATGASSDAVSRMVYALGQVKGNARVMGGELMQLGNAGLSMGGILERLGNITRDQLKDVPFEEFIEAAVQEMEVFTGAAKEQANTFSGLLSSMKELKGITLRGFFSGIFEAAQPYIASVVNLLSDPKVQKTIEGWGDAVGKFAERFLKGASDIIQGFGRLFQGNILGGTDIMEGLISIGMPAELARRVGLMAEEIFGFVNRVRTAFDKFGTIGGLQAIVSGLLSGYPEIANTLNLILGEANNFIMAFQAIFAGEQGGGWDLMKSLIKVGLPAETAAKLAEVTAVILGWIGEVKRTFDQSGLSGVFDLVKSQIADQFEEITPEDVSEKFWAWTKTVADAAAEKLYVLADAIRVWAENPETQAQIAEAGQVFADHLVNSLSLTAGSQENAEKIVGGLLSALWAVVKASYKAVVTMGANFMAGFIEGVVEALGGNLETWTFAELEQFRDWVLSLDWSVIGKGLMAKIGDGIKSAWDTILGWLEGVYKSSEEAIFSADFGEIGASIVDGILEGLKNNVGGIYDWFRSVFSIKTIAAALGAIGARSPSKLFMQVGESIIQGIDLALKHGSQSLEVTIEKVMGPVLESAIDKTNDMIKAFGRIHRLGNVKTNMGKLIKSVSKSVAKALPEISAQILALEKQGGEVTTGALAQIIHKSANIYAASAVTIAENFKSHFIEVAHTLEDVTKQAMTIFSQAQLSLAQTLTGVAQSAFDRLSQSTGDLQSQLQKIGETKILVGRNTITSVSDVAREFEELTTRQKLFEAAGKTVSDRTMKRMEALKQILQDQGYFELQQKLTEEQEKQLALEEKRAKIMQQQQDIAFLQQQLGLLKTIQDFGLDPSEILGGLQLGLDVNLEQLIEAVSNATQAIVDQVNADLQISSPSKVMFRAGERIMQGLAEGIRSGIDMVQNAMPGGSTYNQQQTYNLTVNTAGQTTSIVNDFKMMKAMASSAG